MAAAQYEVSRPFRGVDVAQANAIVSIPKGAILRLVQRQAANTFVTVRWDQRELLVFDRDFCERAIEEPWNPPFPPDTCVPA